MILAKFCMYAVLAYFMSAPALFKITETASCSGSFEDPSCVPELLDDE
jgi:hypothetical protein